MQRMDLLRKLRALVDHPATPEHERASARARIAELEAPRRVPVARTLRPEQRAKAKLAGLRARPKADLFPEEWPFGWRGPRIRIEHEAALCPDGALALGWKCPSCGTQVERRIPERVMRQLMRPVVPGKPSPLSEHIKRMTGGQQNQLCRLCWGRWDAA